MASSQKRKREANGETPQSTPKYTRVLPPGYEDPSSKVNELQSSTHIDNNPSKIRKSTVKSPITKERAQKISDTKFAKVSKPAKPTAPSADNEENLQETIVVLQEPTPVSVGNGADYGETKARDGIARLKGTSTKDQRQQPANDTAKAIPPQANRKLSRVERRKLKLGARIGTGDKLAQNNKTDAASGEERIGGKETKVQRRKRNREARKEASGASAPGDRSGLKAGKENLQANARVSEAGENETKAQRRKRKREAEKEASNTLDRDDTKRAKNKHETPLKSTVTKETGSQPVDRSKHSKQNANSARKGKGMEVGGDGIKFTAQDVEVGAQKLKTETALTQVGQSKGGSSVSQKDGSSLAKLASRSSASRVSKQVAWKTSEPIGGHMVNADTVFSADEKYLILALPSALKIYSASTSLLVRSLSLDSSRSRKAGITSYVLSPTCPNQLYVCTDKGRLEVWDWMVGTKLQRWEFESEMETLAVIPSDSTKNSDIIFVIEKKHGKWRIKQFEVLKLQDAKTADSKTTRLFESDQPISNLRILQGGRAIFATSANKLIVGMTKDGTPAPSYVWIELTSADWLTCLDVRESSERSAASKGKNDKSKGVHSKSNPTVDVVLGDLKGVIFVHTDLLNKLDIMKPAGKPAEWEYELKSATKRIHWHREAVHSVKWSLDGNYIISGGAETVLVLWQMDTTKSQHLPHLSATIEGIVVSPTGSSYAIRLADNSVMVLSTSELKPKANIAGIQAISWKPSRIPEEAQVKTVDSEELKDMETPPEIARVPSVINPVNPSHILLAVPSFQSNSFGPPLRLGSPFLQTYDYAAAQHVSRQVLARAYVTWKNVTAGQAKVGEPNIVLMKISRDGKWLATVDEWVPPARDLEFLGLEGKDLTEELNRRREVYLKFWGWNEEHTQWELVTRVDRPHSQDGYPSSAVGQITDMAANPKAVEFATIGRDGSVRFWSPKKKTRDGIVVKSAESSKPLLYWSCRRITQLGLRHDSIHLVKSRNKHASVESCALPSLAYSDDGSVLAASSPAYFARDPSIVRLIDAGSGEIRHVREGSQTGPIIAIGIIGPYLILVGDMLVVWDIVRDTFQWGFKLRAGYTYQQRIEKVSMIHLAVDHVNGTFAVAQAASRSFEPGQVKRSQVLIFDPKDPTPIHSVLLPNAVTSLLPAVGHKGYVAIDIAAELRFIGPGGNKGVPQSITQGAGLKKNPSQEEKADEQDAAALDGVDDEGGDLREKMAIESYLPRPEARSLDVGDDSPVVRREKLSEIFDVGPSYALPPVSELFNQVANLFLRKPLPREEAV